MAEQAGKGKGGRKPQEEFRDSRGPKNTCSYIQILGTGLDTQDTSPCVLLFFDQRRFLFNVGEGLQRLCMEHKIRITKFDHVFLTRVSCEASSGLPGLLLTLYNAGDKKVAAPPALPGKGEQMDKRAVGEGRRSPPKVEVWGPTELAPLLDAMKSFVPLIRDLKTHLFGHGPLPIPPSRIAEGAGDLQATTSGAMLGEAEQIYKDELVTISAVVLVPESRLATDHAEESRARIVARFEQMFVGEAGQTTGISNADEPACDGATSAAAGNDDVPPPGVADDTSMLDAPAASSAPLERLGWRGNSRRDEAQGGATKRARTSPPDEPGDSPSSTGGGVKAPTRSGGGGRQGTNVRGTQGADLVPGERSVVYVCKLEDIAGKFDAMKAEKLGLRPGVKRAALKGGKSVLSDDGLTTIHPHDVMDPTIPGPVVLVVDCPTPAHMLPLLSAPGLARFCRESGLPDAEKVTCVVHLGPMNVVNDPLYRLWMAALGKETHHIFAGHGRRGTVPPVLKGSARIMSRLNLICPQVFPVSGLEQVDASCADVARGDGLVEDRSGLLRPEDESQGAVVGPSTAAENLIKFHLRPVSNLPVDRSLVPSALSVAEVQQQLVEDNPEVLSAAAELARIWTGGAAEQPVHPSGTGNGAAQEAQPDLRGPDMLSTLPLEHAASGEAEDAPTEEAEDAANAEWWGEGADVEEPEWLKGVGRDELEIVFLGTGSSQPSKYRNVSAIYLHRFHRGGLLLDCGEGTYGQLIRRYGVRGAEGILSGLKCIWISHIHADHHAGLAQILAARRRLIESRSGVDAVPPVLVVGPRPLRSYLDAYQRFEDLCAVFLDCSQTTEEADMMQAEQDWLRGSRVEMRRGSPEREGAVSGETSPRGGRAGGLIQMGSPRGSPRDGDGAPNRPLQSRGRMQNYWQQVGFHLRDGIDREGRAHLRDALDRMGLSRLSSVLVKHCAHAFGVVVEAVPGEERRPRNQQGEEEGWKVVYSGDTRPCEALVNASYGATVLIHEATFDDGMEEEAKAKNHSMTWEAVETGQEAGAYRTILTHFSQRYPKVPVFDESYKSHTCIAFDMMSVNLADLSKLPTLLPALKLLFKDEMEEVDGEVEGVAFDADI